MLKKILKTSDNSHTIYVPNLNETYHSIYGAITESNHVFIKNGLLRKFDVNDISILEIGYGTGLNILLSYHETRGTNKNINYTAIEPFPLNLEVVDNLNYLNFFKEKDLSKIFLNIHKSKFDVKYKLGDKFHLIKKKIMIENINLKNKYDLVYFDLFAPRVHPNLWTVKIFKQIYDIMNFGSILVTYRSKGSVKRNLKECGFKIESCPGPPGKREITRAVK